MNKKSVIKLRVIDKISEPVARNIPYGIVNDSHSINYRGRTGRLIWDYILYNQITFEDAEDGSKIFLSTKLDDIGTRCRFNNLVQEYGNERTHKDIKEYNFNRSRTTASDSNLEELQEMQERN